MQRGGQRKGMSIENTFSTMNKEEDMFDKVQCLCKALSRDLETENLQGKTVTLKLKTSQFRMITRSRTCNSFVWKSDQINSIAQSVFYFYLC